MTRQEANELPFRFLCHMALASGHQITYKNDEYDIWVYKYTPKRGKTSTVYRIGDKEYKNKESFEKALETIPLHGFKPLEK